MLGNLIILLASWILLRLTEKKSLAALGLLPSRRRLKELGIGLLLTIPFGSAFYLGEAWLVRNPYRLHDAYSFKDLVGAIRWLGNSVIYEDLVFRGVLLYILIRRIGPRKAIWVSGIAFGIYHWFSFEVWGQPVNMLVVFLTTGLIGGTLLAMAFEKTRSMYLGFGLHFGIDFVPMVLFSQSKSIGLQLLVKSFPKDPVNPGTIISLVVYVLYFTWFPLLTFLYLRTLRGHGAANSGIT